MYYNQNPAYYQAPWNYCPCCGRPHTQQYWYPGTVYGTSAVQSRTEEQWRQFHEAHKNKEDKE